MVWDTLFNYLCGLATGVAAYLTYYVVQAIRQRGLDRWVPTYVMSRRPRYDRTLQEPLDVFIAVCDHFEPQTGRAAPHVAQERVDTWCRQYPKLFEQFRDVDGRPPQHTYFFPQDEYRPEHLDELAKLVKRGLGDVDIHLHHHNDTAEGFREKLEVFRNVLHYQHGLLRVDPTTGQLAYGFIHGNWALCNSRRDGCWCGVDHEIPILLDTGCYADFTLPSAPSDTQTRIINSIYYASDRPGRRKSHDDGVLARAGSPPPPDSLLMIQGPLLFDWNRRKFGLLPRMENGDLLSSHPPQIRRLAGWLSAGVCVSGRPNWRFVKLHTHGCKPGNFEMWLSQRTQQFHADLANRHRQNPNFRYHYVTAWEMAQLVHLAERGDTTFPASMTSAAQVLMPHPAVP